MKILPKKVDIDKAKALERKAEIDAGLALAQKVDTLRDTVSKEEKYLTEYRANALAIIQKEIANYIEERDNLIKQNNEARTLRNQLLAPLDEEWVKVNLAKSEIVKDREVIHISKSSLKEQTQKINSELEKISALVSKIKTKEKRIEKIEQEIIALKEMAQREYEMARSEHEIQTEDNERKLLHISQLEKEYEVGITNNKIEAIVLKEKEADLITRENNLARQQRNLKIVYDEIHK